MWGSHHPQHVSPEVLWVHVLGYWFVTRRVTLALWCTSLSQLQKAEEDEQCLVKLTVKWRSGGAGRENVWAELPTEPMTQVE